MRHRGSRQGVVGGKAPDDSPLSPSLSRAALAAHAVKAGLWALVGCGPLALVLAIGGSSSSVQRAVMWQPGRSGVGPSGFAELYVAAYLDSGADSSALRAFYPEAPPVSAVAGRRQVTRTVTTALREIQPGYWDVTVAVDVTSGRQGGPGSPTARVRFFSVPVVAVGDADAGGTRPQGSSGSYVAVALPAEVAAPATAPGVQVGYDSGSSVSGGPMADTVQRFAAAYLTGVGELDRYLSPGTAIRAVSPPPYRKADVLRIVLADQLTNTQEAVPSDGSEARALATVEVTDTDGQPWPLEYALTLRARAGRWEVSGMDPGPLIRGAGGTTPGVGAPPPGINVEPSEPGTP